jgi:NADPH-dependent 2,4-dienoyl-CoA reductase/sulfur reductase-like enzyme/rhodanese-related sulfurtransferase/two-component sensor histidine kinase
MYGMDSADERMKNLETRLREYQEEISRLLKNRNEYLRVSAHQMKSPLATILFSIDTLLGDYAGRLNSKQLRVVESIRRSTKELQSLIMDILELERFRSGKVELGSVDFTEICARAIDDLRDKIREKNIQFRSDMPRFILITRGNESGLRHAVYNIIENAIKYSPRDGTVEFFLSHDAEKKLIRMKVRDHGIGITKEAIQHIYEEFYRSPNARLFDKSGTGFGLAIVKQIIEGCKGSVSINSKEIEGTTVDVTLELLDTREPGLGGGAQTKKKIVVIGGVAAGPKAASRARRYAPDTELTVFEKENFLAYVGCALPFYIAGRLKNQRELFVKRTRTENETEYFREVKGIEIRNLCEVVSIERGKKRVVCREVLTNRFFEHPYDKLIIATGSSPDIPEIKGVDLANIFVLHGITDSERIKRAIANESARDILVLGGGKIGVETAEALTVSGGRITIVEKEAEILPFLDPEMAALVRLRLERRGVRIIRNDSVKEFQGTERVEYAVLSDYTVRTDLVVLATRFKPNVGLAKEAGLKIGSSGAIAVDEFLLTTDESIYAAGDCVEVKNAVTGNPQNLPLGSLANQQGRIAGTNAAGGAQTFGPVTGTTVSRAFDYNFAKTGISEREAVEAGLTPLCCYSPDYDRDPFLEDARMINTKMIAERETGRLLGVQIVGEGEVTKHIDIASSIITRKGKIHDVLSLDLGYTPAYSQAIDNIVTAAHVLQNKIDGLFEGATARETKGMLEGKKDCSCIDVRNPEEFEEEHIPGFDLIPLESLRRRIDEIPPDKNVILACDTGARAYQAALILKSHGFRNVKILEGGLCMWPYRVARE